MTLNAQERAAVEAAKAWIKARSEGGRFVDHFGDAEFGFQRGHLSGFRAGVEAAIEALNKNNEDAGGAYVSDINAIRALLAQEAGK